MLPPLANIVVGNIYMQIGLVHGVFVKKVGNFICIFNHPLPFPPYSHFAILFSIHFLRY